MVDWDRVKSALNQTARRQPDAQAVPGVLEKLNQLTQVCGPASQNRKMLVRLGNWLLKPGIRTIAVPCCPDYTHQNGVYTFSGLHDGVSLLAQKHITFLQELTGVLPDLNILLMYADHESDDPELLRVTGQTKPTFETLVGNSVSNTRKLVSHLGWKVEKMTDCIPDLLPEEQRNILYLSSNPEFRRRIESETMARIEMYWKIRFRMEKSEMIRRTIATAAQYIALGNFAASQDYAVCNHTTTNLSWYLHTEAALLHNPVSVY